MPMKDIGLELYRDGELVYSGNSHDVEKKMEEMVSIHKYKYSKYQIRVVPKDKMKRIELKR